MPVPIFIEGEIPTFFSSREKLQEITSLGTLAEALGVSEKNFLRRIVTVLRSSELAEQVNAGNVTLAMIKPALIESSTLDANQYSEDEQAQKIISDIKVPLVVGFEIVLTMDVATINEWYQGGPKESQLALKPINPQRYGQTHANRWEEYLAMMQRGPVTFLLLYSHDNNAVAEWRQQMGNHWNVEKTRELFPDSLRAQYGKDQHNNIVHGSDSIESVQREIKLLASLIEKLV